MGRPFVEFLDEERCSAKYVCSCCGVDVASKELMIWEGYMGAQKPAYLFSQTTNIDQFGDVRKERLTTGAYSLLNVRCRWCYTVLGCHYIEAENPDQKYKEGGTLLEQGKLIRQNFPSNSSLPVRNLATTAIDRWQSSRRIRVRNRNAGVEIDGHEVFLVNPRLERLDD